MTTEKLHIMTTVCQSSIIPLDWKRRMVAPIWKGNWDCQNCDNYWGITLLSAPCNDFPICCSLGIRSKVLKLQIHEQPEFTPGNLTTDRIPSLRALVEQ